MIHGAAGEQQRKNLMEFRNSREELELNKDPPWESCLCTVFFSQAFQRRIMPMHCILQPGLPETAVTATGQGSFCTAMTGIYFIFIFIFMIFFWFWPRGSARRDAWMIFDLAMTIIYFIFTFMIYSFINVNVFKFYVLLLLLHSINLFLLFLVSGQSH